MSEFDVVYRLRFVIKVLVLVDFMVEMSDVRPRDVGENLWILEIDCSSKAVRGGVGMILQCPEGLSIAQAVKFAFSTSNN